MVEMMIIIGIVGIIATISAPPFFRYLTSSRLQTGADRLVADLQYARSLSIANAQILRFTSTAGSYQVINPLNGTVIRQTNLEHGLDLGINQTADFYPWGMADPVVLNLANGAGAKQITLLPTGIVEVH